MTSLHISGYVIVEACSEDPWLRRSTAAMYWSDAKRSPRARRPLQLEALPSIPWRITQGGLSAEGSLSLNLTGTLAESFTAAPVDAAAADADADHLDPPAITPGSLATRTPRLPAAAATLAPLAIHSIPFLFLDSRLIRLSIENYPVLLPTKGSSYSLARILRSSTRTETTTPPPFPRFQRGP